MLAPSINHRTAGFDTQKRTLGSDPAGRQRSGVRRDGINPTVY